MIEDVTVEVNNDAISKPIESVLGLETQEKTLDTMSVQKGPQDFLSMSEEPSKGSAELVFLIPDKSELTHMSVLTVNIETVRRMIEGECTDKFGIRQAVSINFQQYIMK